MRMLRTPPFFPPKSREKPYLEVLSRFGLWRDWPKTCQLMPDQWNFTSATLNRIRFVFYHNIEDNERSLCQDLLTIENTNSDLKVHALHYANESYLYASDFPFKNFCKLAQHGEIIRKKCFRVQTTINHISILTFLCFFTTISTSKKMCFFFSERELKKALRDTLTRAAWYGL